MCVWTLGAGQAPGRAPGAEGLVRSDPHLSPPLGLLERELRLDIKLDPNLSLPAGVGGALVWRGWGTPGTMEPRVADAWALRCSPPPPRVEGGPR